MYFSFFFFLSLILNTVFARYVHMWMIWPVIWGLAEEESVFAFFLFGFFWIVYHLLWFCSLIVVWFVSSAIADELRSLICCGYLIGNCVWDLFLDVLKLMSLVQNKLCILLKSRLCLWRHLNQQGPSYFCNSFGVYFFYFPGWRSNLGGVVSFVIHLAKGYNLGAAGRVLSIGV